MEFMSFGTGYSIRKCKDAIFVVVVVVKGAKFTVKGFKLHYLDLNDILRVEVRPKKHIHRRFSICSRDSLSLVTPVSRW